MMVIKDDVKAYLERIAPRSEGPTNIGLGIGIPYWNASSKVSPALKALVAEGWAERWEKPVTYGKAGKQRTNPKG